MAGRKTKAKRRPDPFIVKGDYRMSPTSGCVSAFLELFFKVDIKGSGLHFCQRALLMYWAPASGVRNSFLPYLNGLTLQGYPVQCPAPVSLGWIIKASQRQVKDPGAVEEAKLQETD